MDDAWIHFFVYGTLKRGQCRQDCWPIAPCHVQAAWVAGGLFGRADYPAMRPGQDRVRGECWSFDPCDEASVLRALDRIEGTGQPGNVNLYDRVQQTVYASVLESESESTANKTIGTAWCYHYARDPLGDGFQRIQPDANDWVHWPLDGHGEAG